VGLTKTAKFLELHGYDVAKQEEYTVESIKFEKPLNPNKIPEFIVQVNISSDPSLIEKKFIRVYEITLSGIRPTSILHNIVLVPKERLPKPFHIG
jgi:hypothetical protein